MPVVSQWTVTGMTCGHCVAAVKEEVGKIPGVQDVDVDLVAGGQSTVTVRSEQDLAMVALSEAINEAGYELVGPHAA